MGSIDKSLSDRSSDDIAIDDDNNDAVYQVLPISFYLTSGQEFQSKMMQAIDRKPSQNKEEFIIHIANINSNILKYIYTLLYLFYPL
jgi:hypothetical protein